MSISKEIKVSIIIVNYKTKKLIRDCLKSLYLYSSDFDLEVIIVDNNSNDNIKDMLSFEFPSVKYIQNKVNVGFGAANNVAIKQAKGKYLFLLNPDTIILNDAVTIFYDYCEENKNIGCIGGFLEDTEGNQIHSYGKFLNYWYDLFYSFGYSIKKLLNLKNTKFITPTYQKYGESIEVDYITGADLFVSKETLEQIGVFDESFFMYSEETDLQYRMKIKGLKRIVIPKARIIHLEGKSFALSNSRRIMMNVSKLKYVKKHKGILAYILMKSVYLVSASIALFSDTYYKEYSYTDNINYIKCLFNNDYQ
jgi:GT2 family glycosyltransferase